MIATAALLVVSILGVGGSAVVACLLVWSVHEDAKLRLEDSDSLPDLDEGTTNGVFRLARDKLKRNSHWIILGTIVLSVLIVLLLSDTVSEVMTLAKLLGGISVVYLLHILIVLLLCHQKQDPTKLYTVTRSIGIFHVLVTLMAVSVYSIATLTGNNPAADESSYYHGPAPIVNYEGQNLNYDDVARKASIVVGYGGSWACPSQPADEWCQEDLELGWCDIYDKTGYWYGSNLEATWRQWEGEDLWESSSFSCARGFTYGEDDDYEYDEANNNQYLDDPFDAPAQIIVFADCTGNCRMVIDDPIFQGKFYHVASLKNLMMVTGICAMVFLFLGGVIHYRSNWYKAESATLKETAGTELLPADHEEENPSAVLA